MFSFWEIACAVTPFSYQGIWKLMLALSKDGFWTTEHISPLPGNNRVKMMLAEVTSLSVIAAPKLQLSLSKMELASDFQLPEKTVTVMNKWDSE